LKFSHSITSDEYAAKFGEFRKIKPISTRVIKKLTCAICGKEYSSVGMFAHIRDTHQITKEDYVTKFGEYNSRKEKLDVVSAGESGDITCLIDGKQFSTSRQLYGYIHRIHKLSADDYVLKYIFNGVKPTCKCGCGADVTMFPRPPYRVDYITGHNAIGAGNPNYKKTSTLSTREKMRIRALERISNTVGTLPMHSPEAIQLRGKMQTDKFLSRMQIDHNVTILCREVDGHEYYYKSKCNTCGNEFEQYHQSYFKCPVCYPRCKSIIETDIIDHLIKLDGSLKILHNNRQVIPGNLELDLYFPDKKIAIEIDGLFWHGELQGKDKKYHLNKTIECEKLGIHLVHVFEDEWELNRSMVLHKIGQKLGIFSGEKYYARKCEVHQLEFNECKMFLELNHLQGGDISPIRLGLFSKDELVSVMTFSKPNTSRGNRAGESEPDSFELSRFATKENTLCIGAGSKLLTHFIRANKPKKIISYADRRWSSSVSNVYMKLGFNLVRETDPCYWYFKPNERIRFHRFNFTKQKTIEMGGEPKMTEWQNMQNFGYDRIWDCGHLKYQWTAPT